jgi:type IV pilus assembly protein PilA
MVIVIIGILAAIAIPIFLAQREKAYIAHIQSALKNAATAVESWAVSDTSQSFAALDGQDGAFLDAEGFQMPAWATTPGNLSIEASKVEYCIQATYNELSPTNQWRRATYQSSVGKPQQNPDTCPALSP